MQLFLRASARLVSLSSFALFAAVSAATLPAHAKTKAAPAAATGSYAGAIAIDAATGTVLVEENADVINPPASMAKLMTFAVVADKIKDGSLTLQTPIKVEASDAKMGGTQVYLDPRETFPVEELLYAMMIQSANDAAHALARTAGGSVEGFVELMNAKARALGMNHTTFRTPHGLPPPSRRLDEGDLTTPRDFATLCRYLVENTDVLKYTSVRERQFGTARTQGAMAMRNHNNLLGKVTGVDGLKTGYTASAGYCLSATAERNGRRVIVVIMGSFGPGRSIDKGKFRDIKAIEFLERGFTVLAKASAPTTALPTVSSTPAATGKSAPAPVNASAAKRKAAPGKPEEIPTVKTGEDKPADAASTAKEPAVIFRLPTTPPKS